jgi:solute carrier family 8 (sodium/calcium exchanger)
MVESKSKQIIDFFCAEKTMVEYSGKMEPFALKPLLIRLHKKKIHVRVCTTDRSGALKNLMKDINKEREQRFLPPIKHCFDSWHFVKSVAKDIWKAAKLKKCVVLSCWIKSVKNMIWFGVGSCGGSAEMLVEMILSIPKHVAGIHTFPENRLFKKCLHGPLPSVRDKPWLRESSMAMKKLTQAVRGHKDCRIKDLQHMTEFQHTSINEQLNHIHNIYLPKSLSFGPVQARVRGCLTAIDHNCNVNRPAKKDKDGEDQYTVTVSRDGQMYTAKPVKVAKNTAWRAEIMAEVVEAVRTGTVPTQQIPTDEHLKLYGKREHKPDKSLIVAATKARSRFRDLRKQ